MSHITAVMRRFASHASCIGVLVRSARYPSRAVAVLAHSPRWLHWRAGEGQGRSVALAGAHDVHVLRNGWEHHFRKRNHTAEHDAKEQPQPVGVRSVAQAALGCRADVDGSTAAGAG